MARGTVGAQPEGVVQGFSAGEKVRQANSRAWRPFAWLRLGPRAYPPK